MTVRSRLVSALLISVYLLVMAWTNARFTMLDDECGSVAIAGRPLAVALRPFLTGEGYRELHPPLAEILLHFWLVATNYSFALIRVFANLFFAGAVLLTAKSAARVAGRLAYWVTLLIGLVWPFAFQYGRIAGWYTLSTFLLALVTWLYLRMLEDSGNRWLVLFGVAAILLVWSNYFSFAFLLLLLADLLIFHRNVAREHIRPLILVMSVIASAFLPLLRVAIGDVAEYVGPVVSGFDWRQQVAAIGYPAFALFGTAAVAPWYLPLSLPILLAALALVVSSWFSPSRRWIVYVAVSMVAMVVCGVFDIKRVLFFLPWMFLAMGIAAADLTSRYPRVVRRAIAVIVIAGWIGIASGRHAATTNLHEPWGEVARVVAQDARRGAVIVSENAPFFFYLDYQLGLQADTGAADGPYLGESLYRANGYRILQPDDYLPRDNSLHGKVVTVNGSGFFDDVQGMNALDDSLRQRCTIVGEYRASPDPAIVWKRRFTKRVPTLTYRTSVTWYDCH